MLPIMVSLPEEPQQQENPLLHVTLEVQAAEARLRTGKAAVCFAISDFLLFLRWSLLLAAIAALIYVLTN